MVLLTYQVARWAQERGDRVFHLGGGVGGRADSLYGFKAGFSSLRYPYRTWRIVADAETYRELTSLWEEKAGKNADAPTEFFPAYRKPLPVLEPDRAELEEPRISAGEPEPCIRPLVIVGAGGHGREILGLFLERGEGSIVAGFVDDSPFLRDSSVDDKPVLGGFSWLVGHSSRYRAIVAVGDNPRRLQLVERLRKAGVRFGSAISPSAKVSPFASLGEGTMICAQTVINSGVVIGDHTIVNVAATVSHGAHIGSFAHLAPGVHISGDACVEDGVLLGTGAVVNPGISVGAWTIVGSGAVVVTDLGSGITAVGVPAREPDTRWKRNRTESSGREP